jgi:hypothetical protein
MLDPPGAREAAMQSLAGSMLKFGGHDGLTRHSGRSEESAVAQYRRGVKGKFPVADAPHNDTDGWTLSGC